MQQLFKPAKLLLYLLAAILGLMLGAMLAGLLGAGKGQGLAGGAIVLGYGVMGSLIAFISSIIIASYLTVKQVIKINKIVVILLLIFIGGLTYRYLNKEKTKTINTGINKKPTPVLRL
ncbi:hypothetical protein [Spongiimicrobium sp. 3-5]|uniref:hypothetical protein n=1 Tax=Spongiimicrobium sp. 3-5 TaxID=3332596 RepID=UPI003980F6DA